MTSISCLSGDVSWFVDRVEDNVLFEQLVLQPALIENVTFVWLHDE